MEKNGDTNSERSHLRHGDVDEDNAALNDVQPKIDQQPRQKNAGHDRPEHYFPHDYGRDPASCGKPSVFVLDYSARLGGRALPINAFSFQRRCESGNKRVDQLHVAVRSGQTTGEL